MTSFNKNHFTIDTVLSKCSYSKSAFPYVFALMNKILIDLEI